MTRVLIAVAVGTVVSGCASARVGVTVRGAGRPRARIACGVITR